MNNITETGFYAELLAGKKSGKAVFLPGTKDIIEWHSPTPNDDKISLKISLKDPQGNVTAMTLIYREIPGKDWTVRPRVE
jgi:hypothetical protein